MRLLLLGATGVVGRDIVRRLSRQPDLEIVAVGRNQVLLDHLAEEFNVYPLALDLQTTTTTASDLPDADVVLDLTFASGGRPRELVRGARHTIATLASYLERHPSSRLIHAGTWVVTINGAPKWDQTPRTRLDWSDMYLLAKTAAEKALATYLDGARVALVRLGNVLAPDSAMWIDVARAVRSRHVAASTYLDGLAGLSTVDELLTKVVDSTQSPLTYTSSIAGFTWRDVLRAVDQELDLDLGPAPWQGEPGGRSPAPSPGALTRRRRALQYRVLGALPEGTRGFLAGLPGGRRLAPAARQFLRAGLDSASPTEAVELPSSSRFPTAGRDAEGLNRATRAVAAGMRERGDLFLFEQRRR